MTVDLSSLNGAFGFRIDGIDAEDFSGVSVAGVGDINGDGLGDLIIGAPLADLPGRSGVGEAYVVFGRRLGFDATLSLDTLNGSNGFRIQGTDALDFTGLVVDAAGDFNGDGIDDLVIGAPLNSDQVGDFEGQSYVVFGRRTGFDANLSLASLNGINGFSLEGVFDNTQLGWVSGAGDLNGDGFDDLVIGSQFTDAAAQPRPGTVHVVFGGRGPFASSDTVLFQLGNDGFTLDGLGNDDLTGRSSGAAGDVNGDGIDDLIIGAPGASPGSRTDAGVSYVVFGTRNRNDFPQRFTDLDGSNGFRIDGEASFDRSGISVDGAGDVNGDGLDDLIIGAREANPNGRFDAGAAYVVFGRATGFDANLSLAALDGSDGFRINGAAVLDQTGTSVAAAGDVNGDGLDDLIIGAAYANIDGRSDAGASYVVFGRSTGFAAEIDPAQLSPTQGFRINGIGAGDYSGYSVDGAGDHNGDGFDDLVIGAFGADRPGRNGVGASFVVFGRPLPLEPIEDADAAANLVAETAAPGARTGLTARAIDPAANATVLYSLEDDAGGRFAIDPLTGVVTVVKALDFERASSHLISVQADSPVGGTRFASFTLQVGDVDERLRPLRDVDLGTNLVSETAAPGDFVGLTARASDPDTVDQVSYALTNDAGGRFAIDPNTGVVTVAGPLDFESAASHRIVVRASSSGGDSRTAGFTIAVGNADDPLQPLGPLADIAAAPNRVAESAAPGARVGILARAIDPDRADSVTYALTDSAGGRFAIDANSGLVTLAGALDFDTAASHQITVRATSSGGDSQSAGFTIAVTDVAEPLGPVADISAVTNRVAESAAPGARVGIIARAIDPDRADSVSYALTDSAGGRFAINAATGLVTVAGPLDFETARSHQITVQATSSGGGSQSASFAITVTDVADITPIPGTAGPDRLTGSRGDDIFTPGAGADVMSGRGGNDVFVFALETRNGVVERDTITDFALGDLLDLGDAQVVLDLLDGASTVLVLDGDGDQIRLSGFADFDLGTMLA